MTQRHRLRAGFVLCTILLLSACAGPKINPPGPDVEALLVIPVETDIKVVSAHYGFYYVYEIIRYADRSFVHQIDIKFPLSGNVLVVDSLAPGNYLLRKVITRPRGSGDKTISNSETYRYDPFKLEAGKITIFPQVLKLTMRNQDPGRVGSILSWIDMIQLRSGRRNEVIKTLEKLPNFEAWEISTGN